jgi:hypothetical protein
VSGVIRAGFWGNLKVSLCDGLGGFCVESGDCLSQKCELKNVEVSLKFLMVGVRFFLLPYDILQFSSYV